MKSIKSLTYIVTATLALALGAATTKAVTPGIGIVTNSTPLNVSITVITNGPPVTSGNTQTISTGKTTINNKFLLNVFAHWDNTNWPAGSKLVIGWDGWGGDVLVVDSTGTNVLFDANATENNYFTVFYYTDYGAQYYKDTGSQPGMFTYTDYNDGEMKLFDNNVYLTSTDLDIKGGATVTYTQNWNAQGAPTTWNVNASLTAQNNAAQTFLGKTGSTASGTAKSSGSGKSIIFYFNL